MRVRPKTSPVVKTYVKKKRLASDRTVAQVTLVSSVDRVSRTRKTTARALVAAREAMGVRPWR